MEISLSLSMLPFLSLTFAVPSGIYQEADRFGHADGICDLHEGFIGYACCHKVFGNITGSICCRAVDLGGVLSGESAAAVCAAPTVGIDDDLPAGQA